MHVPPPNPPILNNKVPTGAVWCVPPLLLIAGQEKHSEVKAGLGHWSPRPVISAETLGFPGGGAK
jgi:hypothetical protein